MRVDNQNSINTKIRAGKSDFILLARNKSDKTPWSNINQTIVPIEMDAHFEVGKLSIEDTNIEMTNEKNRINVINNRKDQNPKVRSNNIYEFLPVDEEIDRLMYQSVQAAENMDMDDFDEKRSQNDKRSRENGSPILVVIKK